MKTNDFVNGWKIRERSGGGFEVADGYGGVQGPYATNEAAIAAALKLPAPINMAATGEAKRKGGGRAIRPS